MKKILFMLAAFALPFLCFAQTDPLRTDLNTLFGALNASQVPSGYLVP